MSSFKSLPPRRRARRNEPQAFPRLSIAAECARSPEEVCAAYKPLILHAIRTYANYPHHYDDLLQDGFEELLRAREDFDPARGVHPAAYYKARQTLFFRNKARFLRRRDMLPLLDESEGGIDPEDPVDHFAKVHTRLYLDALMAELTPEEDALIRAYYVDGKTAREIADRLGTTTRRVHTVKERAMRKLRRAVAEERGFRGEAEGGR